jgi:hypothetical protein
MTAVNGVRAGAFPASEGRMFYGKPLVYRETTHEYFWAGEKIPSVTTILGRLAKPALIQWAANMAVDYIEENWEIVHNDSIEIKPAVFAAARKAHRVKKETAADVGTYTHAYAQDCLKANRLLPVPISEDLQGEFEKTKAPPEMIPKLIEGVRLGCDGFGNWFRKHEVHTIEVERQVVSAQHLYAGRCDFYGRIDGKLGVLDIKTSGGVYEDYWLQLTAYQGAITEEKPVNEPVKNWVLHLDKNTGAHKLHARDLSAPMVHAWIALVMFDRYWRIMEKTARAA